MDTELLSGALRTGVLLTALLGLMGLSDAGLFETADPLRPRAPSPAPQPLAGAPGDSLYVPDGLEATLWAESPKLYNPTNIDVDRQGRVWAVEAVNYRAFNNPDSTRRSRKGERVVILEDTDGNGTADTSKVFVRDEDLVSPLGIAVMGNTVVVSASPSLYVYTDTDGDDKADRRETLLTGFGGRDHDHGLHTVTAGPDGRWYFNVGNAGPHVVTDASGWTLRAGNVYNGGTPYMGENKPGLVSDDGNVWTGGLAMSVRPSGEDLEVLGHNFRNPYEMAVDSYGRLWSNDNDGGAQSCRVLWLMEGANTGFFSAEGSRMWRADRRPGQDAFTAQWHQEDPGVIPAGDRTGAGSPTGITVYEGDALGEAYRGMVLSAEAGRNVILGYRPTRNGAGYEMGEPANLISSIPDSLVEQLESEYQWPNPGGQTTWFRPSDVAVGPSGALYVADWYDGVVGGHRMQDSTAYGRIYRVAPSDRSLSPPQLDLSTTEGQIRALKTPADNVRYQGFRRLEEQGAAVLDEVEALLDAENPYHRARAVWLLARIGPDGRERVEALLDAPDPTMRTTAYRALRRVTEKDRLLTYARRLATDPSPAVRRAVAVSLRDRPIEQTKDLIMDLMARYEGDRRWELEALGLAAEGHEEQLYPLLRKRFGSDRPADWSSRYADLVWRLHPPAAVDALEARAEAPGLSWDERKRALVALGFIDDRRAVAAMERLSTSDRPSVARRAAWWLDYRKTNEWRDLKEWEGAEGPEAETRRALRSMRRQKGTVVSASVPFDRRVAAARTMAADEHGGRMLVGLRADGRLPGPLFRAVRDSLLANPVRSVRVLAREYLSAGTEKEEMQRRAVRHLPAAQAEQGRTLFYSKCAVCHRAGQGGGRVGPDLTQVRSKFGDEGLVNAIVHPSDGIAHGYSSLQITLKNGSVLFGVLLAEGDGTLTLRDARGETHTLVVDRIAARRRLDVSLMPGPDELNLSAEEVADLAQFLRTVPDTSP
jgi:putative membrane-bound dehydrogenase-like protein